jgi:hypothetical protein
MSYIAFNDAEIAVGKAIKQELFQKTKDNFADHEARISALADSAKKNTIIDDTYTMGKIPSVGEILGHTRILFTTKISEISIQSFLTNGSGVLTIDVLKGSTLNSSLGVSILNSPMSINFSGADYQIVFGSLNVSMQDLILGDYLFIKINSMPVLCDLFRVSALGV